MNKIPDMFPVDYGLPVMDLEKARSEGIIQEVNRLLLHPRGLALCVHYEADVPVALLILDHRNTDGGEGTIFDELDVQKSKNFEALKEVRRKARLHSIGYEIQPLPSQGGIFKRI